MRFVLITCILIGLINFIGWSSFGQATEKLYLSGTGSDNTVEWQFFVTEGRNSGKWTTVPVPSNWELQGFGTYNYGHDKDSIRGKEKGLYKYKFKVPSQWKGKSINIVFEGSMTDTEVKINGVLAGPIHQGSFYRFKYDITHLVKIGKTNLLEVTVSKHSANESVNKAERVADFWIFGGIFRPVYLEAFPSQHIELTAINAQADGQFKANVHLKGIDQVDTVSAQIFTLDGEKVGSEFSAAINKNDTLVQLQAQISSPETWSPEFPNLYTVRFNLLQDEKTIHFTDERFGFRTIELRERDGIYVNGVKIKFKGVNRHSFWPTTGRTTSFDLSLMDAQLIKDMNMNAVRMSHYPPDVHFLEVCDSIGLFVIDELTGWHDAYDTEVGSKLVKQMVHRDVNHPSVVIWSNGNEGGHNLDLDTLFDHYDIQNRPVIHPWQNFRGIDNQHYINYNYGNSNYFQGHDVFFPTEFLHGLYDGGLGAGLKDFWELMWQNPLSAGGFLWVLADEGVVRTDKNGEIDTDGDHGADGILGPFREKEGSFFAIKEIWSPVFIEHREITPAFDGTFNVENRFFYTNLNQCSFSWKLSALPKPGTENAEKVNSGSVKAPDIEPGHRGSLSLSLPQDWQDFDVLYLTAKDPHGREIFTWSWPISLPNEIMDRIIEPQVLTTPKVVENDSFYVASVGQTQMLFNKNNGLLQEVKGSEGVIPFGNGPVLSKGDADFKQMTCRFEGDSLILESSFGEESEFQQLKWTVLPSGWLKLDLKYVMVRTEEDPYGERHDLLGVSFSYPEDQIKSVKYLGSGPYRAWKNRMEGNTLGIWNKEYNNTITGVSGFDYPEFTGYYSNFYWAEFITTGQPFVVATENEDVFLRLFTPEFPEKSYHTNPVFPSGDISFMHGIPPIGTKSQHPVNLGPSGKVNMYFDYWKQRPKEMTLYFNFSQKNNNQ